MRLLLGLLDKNGEISLAQMAKTLKVSSKTIQRDLENLKTQGLLERIGADKGGYWKVIGK